MDGLECSEILMSNLEYSGRIDSEYYQKKYLYCQSLVEERIHSKLGEKAEFLIGPFGSSFDTENYVEQSTFRYIRGQDVKQYGLRDDVSRYITQFDFNRLKKYALKENDILVSVVGTLGNACIVQKKDLPAIFSCKSTVVRVTGINSYFLLSYLNSTFGRDLLLRKERGAIQKGLNRGDLSDLLVPLFSEGFQNNIEAIIKRSLSLDAEAKRYYEESEQSLNTALGIKSFTPAEKSVSIKLYKASFALNGRLDAEYYQPKYEDYTRALNTSDIHAMLQG